MTGGDALALVRILANDHVADSVEALNREPRNVAVELLDELPFERTVEIFDQPELDDASELMAALPRPKAGKVLAAMSVDRAADVLRELEEPARSELLGSMATPLRNTLLGILGYPENSAASIMTTEYVGVPTDWTVGQTLDYIRKVERTRETIYAIYVIDPQTHSLVRAVSLRRLITGQPEDRIMDIAPDRAPVTTSPLADREQLAQLISKYDLLAVPVVENGKILGIVTVDDIIDTMIEETTEDVHRFGGMEALDEPYMKMGFLPMIRKRGGWLCALFLSEMLTANAMQAYESELEKAIVLTLFIPLIMSSGGNSGSQATSLVIRVCAARDRAEGLVARGAPRIADGRRAGRDPRHRGCGAHHALAISGALRLWPALAADRCDGRRGTGRHRHLRLAVGFDAPLRLEADRLRSGKRVCAFRRHAGGCDGAGDLFLGRPCDPAWDLVVSLGDPSRYARRHEPGRSACTSSPAPRRLSDGRPWCDRNRPS